MDDAMDDYPRRSFCGVQRFSWMLPRMIIQGDYVAVQGFSWMMPWMNNQGNHVAVQGF